MLAYLAVPFTLCLVPLAVYLTSLGNRRFARAHAVVALSLSLATILYTFSIVIVGGVLALDSTAVGTLVAAPLLVVLWAGILIVVIRAAAAAGRGEMYQLPRWLRMTSGPPRFGPRGRQSVRPRMTASASSRPRVVSTTRPAA